MTSIIFLFKKIYIWVNNFLIHVIKLLVNKIKKKNHNIKTLILPWMMMQVVKLFSINY